jgi:hypothetical protein
LKDSFPKQGRDYANALTVRLPHKTFNTAVPDLFRGPVSAAYQEQLEVLERIVVTDFLMATDYFSDEAKPGKALRYQGLQKGVCSNPFAVFT